jgi:hypothetical protein
MGNDGVRHQIGWCLAPECDSDRRAAMNCQA